MGNCLRIPSQERLGGADLLSLVSKDHTERIIHFLKLGEYGEWKERLLVEGSYYNRLDLVKYLVSEGTNANSINGQALVVAASRGNLIMVKFLVTIGADVNAQRGKALLYAVRGGHLNIVRYLPTVGRIVGSVEDLLLISRGEHHDYGSLYPHPDMYDLLIDTLIPVVTGSTARDTDRLVIYYL